MNTLRLVGWFILGILRLIWMLPKVVWEETAHTFTEMAGYDERVQKQMQKIVLQRKGVMSVSDLVYAYQCEVDDKPLAPWWRTSLEQNAEMAITDLILSGRLKDVAHTTDEVYYQVVPYLSAPR